MAFDFDSLKPEAKRAAFAKMDRQKAAAGDGKGSSSGGSGRSSATSKTSSAAASSGPKTPETHIADAYRKVAREPGDWVRLAELRPALAGSGLTREQQDAALKEMSRRHRAHISPEPNRKIMTQDDHDNAMRLGGEPNHLVQMLPNVLDELSPTTQPAPSTARRPAAPTKPTKPTAAPRARPPATASRGTSTVTAEERRAAEDDILARAAALDPGDRSPAAQQLRQTAESVRDHRESAAFANRPVASAAARMGASKALPKLKGSKARAQVVEKTPSGGVKVTGSVSRERAAELMFGTAGAARRIRKANAKRR